MNNFNVKDHGVREEMKTGSVRDTQKGKPRFDLVPATCLTKLALHYGAGSEKYGDRNWEKGQSITRYMSSAERHFQYFKMGLTDENHLMACVWNLFCIDWTLDQIAAGNLPKELDDRTPEMLGGRICKDLFARIEENIKVKLEKCDKNNAKLSEKVSIKEATKIVSDNKNNVSTKEDVSKNDKTISEIMNLKGVLDNVFVTICLLNGNFMTYDSENGVKYSRNKADFFDICNECIENDVFMKELDRLISLDKKFVIIPESVFDLVKVHGNEAALVGFNKETGNFDEICKIKDFIFIGLDKKVIDKYEIFVVLGGLDEQVVYK